MSFQQVPIYLTNQEMLSLDQEIFGEHNPHSFLRSCSIHIMGNAGQSTAAILAKMYGATLHNTPACNCTHIVVPNSTEKNDVNNLVDQTGALVVREDWLHACLERRELVPETEFLVVQQELSPSI